MEPLISIITPTNNIINGGFADDFNILVSLLDLQTYPEVEHIIIDNASTDGTVEMLKDYKNKGYLNFFTEKDTGKFDAFNKGIMRAKGKYVAFCSCDDFYHDITAFRDIAAVMEAENADFTFSPAYCRHPEGFVFLFAPAMHNAFQVVPCSRQAMFFKKSVLEKERYFDEKFKLMSDYDLLIRLMMKKYKGIYYPGNFTTYKLGEKSTAAAEKAELECKMIYAKNYRNLYQLTNASLDKMSQYSDFPKELLDKLAEYYPQADKDLFYERCEQMHQIRLSAKKQLKEQAGN